MRGSSSVVEFGQLSPLGRLKMPPKADPSPIAMYLLSNNDLSMPIQCKRQARGTETRAHLKQSFANKGNTVPTFVIEFFIANTTGAMPVVSRRQTTIQVIFFMCCMNHVVIYNSKSHPRLEAKLQALACPSEVLRLKRWSLDIQISPTFKS
jgi:hypothetical protein